MKTHVKCKNCFNINTDTCKTCKYNLKIKDNFREISKNPKIHNLELRLENLKNERKGKEEKNESLAYEGAMSGFWEIDGLDREISLLVEMINILKEKQ